MLLLILLLSGTLAYAQSTATKGVAAVYAAGKISGNDYTNDYFGLTLSSAGGHFTKGGFADSERARLVDVQANPDNLQDRFEIAVLADSLSANPQVHGPQQYAGAVRHQFEKEGMETVSVESPTEVSGVTFMRSVLKVSDDGQVHYRAIYVTFLKGYILALDVSAATPQKIDQLIEKSVHIQPKNN